MALLTTQKITKSGAQLNYDAAAAGGDTFNGNDSVLVHAKNANAGTRTITIAAVTDPLSTPEAGSLAVPDIVVTVPATGDALFSVTQAHLSLGIASMTYDSEVDLTLAVAEVRQ